MPEQVVTLGDKLHIITRRFFSDDVRRHFVGEVTKTSSDLHEITGYVFVFHSERNEYRKRPELRTRIFSLSDAGHIVNKIPAEIELDSLEYRTIDGRLVVTDMRDFQLDINEFGASS